MALILSVVCDAKSRHWVTPARSLSRLARRRSGNLGFSLVEVTLAIGIIAFAIVPMLGLIPMGLSTSRQAVDNTIEAQIIQQLSNQAQQTDFSQLSSLTTPTVSTPLCYDSDGNAATATSIIAYKASMVYTNPSMLPGGSTTTRMGVLTIYVLSTRTSGGMAATNLATDTYSKKYTVLVSDNGR
jgi:uncharacterized protein (TIGR02598 family)